MNTNTFGFNLIEILKSMSLTHTIVVGLERGCEGSRGIRQQQRSPPPALSEKGFLLRLRIKKLKRNQFAINI